MVNKKAILLGALLPISMVLVDKVEATESNGINQPTTTVNSGSLSNVVHFSNERLELSIKKSLKINYSTPITQNDLLRLQTIDFSNLNLTSEDVDFLRYSTNLEVIKLSGNNITDISFLENLDKLRKIDLAKNDISDISVFSNLLNLTHINMFGNMVTDLTPLVEHENLVAVQMASNYLEAIPKLKGVGVLQVPNNFIYDLTMIEDMTNLFGYTTVPYNSMTQYYNMGNIVEIVQNGVSPNYSNQYALKTALRTNYIYENVQDTENYMQFSGVVSIYSYIYGGYGYSTFIDGMVFPIDSGKRYYDDKIYKRYEDRLYELYLPNITVEFPQELEGLLTYEYKDLEYTGYSNEIAKRNIGMSFGYLPNGSFVGSSSYKNFNYKILYNGTELKVNPEYNSFRIYKEYVSNEVKTHSQNMLGTDIKVVSENEIETMIGLQSKYLKNNNFDSKLLKFKLYIYDSSDVNSANVIDVVEKEMTIGEIKSLNDFSQISSIKFEFEDSRHLNSQLYYRFTTEEVGDYPESKFESSISSIDLTPLTTHDENFKGHLQKYLPEYFRIGKDYLRNADKEYMGLIPLIISDETNFQSYQDFYDIYDKTNSISYTTLYISGDKWANEDNYLENLNRDYFISISISDTNVDISSKEFKNFIKSFPNLMSISITDAYASNETFIVQDYIRDNVVYPMRENSGRPPLWSLRLLDIDGLKEVLEDSSKKYTRENAEDFYNYYDSLDALVYPVNQTLSSFAHVTLDSGVDKNFVNLSGFNFNIEKDFSDPENITINYSIMGYGKESTGAGLDTTMSAYDMYLMGLFQTVFSSEITEDVYLDREKYLNTNFYKYVQFQDVIEHYGKHIRRPDGSSTIIIPRSVMYGDDILDKYGKLLDLNLYMDYGFYVTGYSGVNLHVNKDYYTTDIDVETFEDGKFSVDITNKKEIKNIYIAKGEQDIAYFQDKTNVYTAISENTVDFVRENGLYTVYIKDKYGKEMVKTFEIDSLIKPERPTILTTQTSPVKIKVANFNSENNLYIYNDDSEQWEILSNDNFTITEDSVVKLKFGKVYNDIEIFSDITTIDISGIDLTDRTKDLTINQSYELNDETIFIGLDEEYLNALGFEYEKDIDFDAYSDSAYVYIEDKNLQAHVNYLSFGIIGSKAYTEPILKANMSAIYVLDLNNLNLTSLVGLEYAKNALYFNFNGNKIKSIAPLKGLKSLTMLNIANDSELDITSAESQEVLESLDLRQLTLYNNNSKSDTLTLNNPRLKELYIVDNNIEYVNGIEQNEFNKLLLPYDIKTNLSQLTYNDLKLLSVSTDINGNINYRGRIFDSSKDLKDYDIVPYFTFDTTRTFKIPDGDIYTYNFNGSLNNVQYMDSEITSQDFDITVYKDIMSKYMPENLPTVRVNFKLLLTKYTDIEKQNIGEVIEFIPISLQTQIAEEIEYLEDKFGMPYLQIVMQSTNADILRDINNPNKYFYKDSDFDSDLLADNNPKMVGQSHWQGLIANMMNLGYETIEYDNIKPFLQVYQKESGKVYVESYDSDSRIAKLVVAEGRKTAEYFQDENNKYDHIKAYTKYNIIRNGEYTFYVEDGSGNYEIRTIVVSDVNIDKPKVTYSTKNLTNENVLVTVEQPIDSTIELYVYDDDLKDWVVADRYEFDFDKNGQKVIKFVKTNSDGVKFHSQPTLVTVNNIDKENEDIILTPKNVISTEQATKLYSQIPDLKNIFYTIDGGSPQTYTTPIQLPIGDYVLELFSEDLAGNFSERVPFNLSVIDTSTPPIEYCTDEDGILILDENGEPIVKTREEDCDVDDTPTTPEPPIIEYCEDENGEIILDEDGKPIVKTKEEDCIIDTTPPIVTPPIEEYCVNDDGTLMLDKDGKPIVKTKEEDCDVDDTPTTPEPPNPEPPIVEPPIVEPPVVEPPVDEPPVVEPPKEPTPSEPTPSNPTPIVPTPSVPNPTPIIDEPIDEVVPPKEDIPQSNTESENYVGGIGLLLLSIVTFGLYRRKRKAIK